MNRLLILAVFLWSCGAQPPAQLQETPPQTQAPLQTQTQLNLGACAQYQAADQELNALYQQVLKLYAADAVFLKAFKASQTAWLHYRDAQLEALFPTPPGQEKRFTYGSVYPMCSCTALAELTAARNQQLRVWVKGTAEGDVCSGSVRRQE